MKKDNDTNTQLPWEHPKLSTEDPNSLKLIKEIEKSSTYKLAENDEEFLESYQARGIRLELD